MKDSKSITQSMDRSKEIVCGKYLFSPGEMPDEEQFLWMESETGEGMSLSEEQLDKIWKDYL